MMNQRLKPIKTAAKAHGLPADLVAAVVEQESGGHRRATRYEPGYRWLHGKDLDPDEVEDQSTSWGLMQVMGATARELGHAGPLTDLLEAEVGLDIGCAYLARLLKRHRMATPALAAYNAGRPDSERGLRYAASVLKRRPRFVTALAANDGEE